MVGYGSVIDWSLAIVFVKSPAVVLRERIKYVGGGRGFYKFYRKHSVAQGTIELNISWLSNHFQKNVICSLP